MLIYKIWLNMVQFLLKKASFDFHNYVNDLGPMSRSDLGLAYVHIFNNSISCLGLPAFRSQAATVSEKKSTVFIFPIESLS